nr:immunoglobulin light chain junction region [Macaca mulatta]MPN81466.1 immunoglobulin light chain junction region [Macaca mulatta]
CEAWDNSLGGPVF